MKLPCLLVVCGLACASLAQTSTPQKLSPPPTPTDNVTEVLHGVTVTDPYRWLEDQDSPKTRTWIDAQNAYTHAMLDRWPGRAPLEKRLTELMKVESIQSPVERHGRFFYRRRLPDQEQFVVYMRQGVSGKDEVLIDANAMSADHSTSVEIADVSNDGKLLAYMIRTGGRDESEVRVLNVDTRKDLSDKLPDADYFDLAFLPDASGFYYATMLADGPRVKFHKMGTEAATDPEVFGKGYGKESIVIGDPTLDGRYLVIQVFHGSAADKTEIWLQDLAKKGPIVPVVKDIDARFFAFPGGNRLYLQTNWKAPHGRILAIGLADPSLERSPEIVPEDDTAIDSVNLGAGKIIVSYVKNASSVVKVFTADGKPAGKMTFPALGSTFGMQSRWDQKAAFVGFSSFAIPATIFRYDVETAQQSIWAQPKVPVDGASIEVEQVWVTSKDGTKVPMFLVHGKGLKRDRARPTLLTGYGGFTVSNTPHFSSAAIIFAEHGGVYALANLRGGGEFGEAWHQNGMLGKKQNVFDDFIAASEWLIQNQYSNPAKLSIFGGSNGGLLVGAALTQRPELYQAVVCWHPLLDMLRYDKFMEAQFWVSEYGSATNADQFKWLYAYSPYQHVKKGVKYPAVLFMTGDGDTRVAPLHARKMAALLQADTASDRPILLRYELKAGHAGGRSVSQNIGDQTDQLGFLLWQLGVTE
ncbi:MAG TPA: prolyl oligopeptidase family serine peptidase [Candidatus Bathyarchaeia archaeon]|nr:prolyl oligopeptidase family serine peptidase [Candidatus Bathyarchaeia archaeon]